MCVGGSGAIARRRMTQECSLAILAATPASPVLAYAIALAGPALSANAVVGAEATTPAVPAQAPLPAVLAHAAAVAFCALTPHPSMIASAAAPTLCASRLATSAVAAGCHKLQSHRSHIKRACARIQLKTVFCKAAVALWPSLWPIAAGIT